MKRIAVLTAAAVAAATLTATAQAGPHRQHVQYRRSTARWYRLTLPQKRAVVVRAIVRERAPLRFWLRHRARFPESAVAPYVYCGAIGIRTPAPVCRSSGRLVESIHVRRRIDRKIAVRAEAAFLALAGRDFESSARVADRIFPGVGRWLMSCSSSEGGHGAFVMNRYGSGAGGNMQFMSSTFYSNVDGAFAAARMRGFVVPAQARSWHSPLGQAVTAGWMRYTGSDRGQWTGSRC